jgi:RNA polymerase sigma-70 factor (ECF subfamily)
LSERASTDAAIAAARPRVVGALLRWFRDLEVAEEAFQEASVRALQRWPVNGPPRDPVAWLVFVGRNVSFDEARRRARLDALTDEPRIEIEPSIEERLDASHYRDDVLRLLFICCHEELPPAQQIAVALRIVSGLTVSEIARAFMISERAMEQRITRAKRKIAESSVPFEPPDPIERAHRLGAVAAMIYLLFNEGYAASGGEAHIRVPLCEEAIRLARLLLQLYPGEPEIMGLTALLLLQHARASARLDASGAIVLLEDQDRGKWDRDAIAEGSVLIEKAMRHRQPGPMQIQAAIAAVHAAAPRAEDTDWAEIDQLYAALERLLPSPVVSLNRAVALAKVRGPAVALATIEPLAEPLADYFHFHGLRGALLAQLGRDAEARAAFERALPLAHTVAEAAHIRMQIDRL